MNDVSSNSSNSYSRLKVLGLALLCVGIGVLANGRTPNGPVVQMSAMKDSIVKEADVQVSSTGKLKLFDSASKLLCAMLKSCYNKLVA